jgi:hypothetical protein
MDPLKPGDRVYAVYCPENGRLQTVENVVWKVTTKGVHMERYVHGFSDYRRGGRDWAAVFAQQGPYYTHAAAAQLARTPEAAKVRYCQFCADDLRRAQAERRVTIARADQRVREAETAVQDAHAFQEGRLRVGA